MGSNQVGKVLGEDVGEGGFFIFHDVAVDLVDHILVFVADVICDIFFGDVEVEHEGDDVVAQIVEAEVIDLGASEQAGERFGDGVQCHRGQVLLVTTVRVGLFEDRADGGHHRDGSLACGRF